jgi:hypothetical protein
MNFTWLGLIAALATFLGIWLGHVSVRKVEFISPTVWLPSLAALLLGIALEAAAMLTENMYLSAALGIIGFTLLWDALEFWRQHRRVESGHAPANPNNPRHAHLLEAGGSATTIDWLARDPLGRELSAEELQTIQESEG